MRRSQFNGKGIVLSEEIKNINSAENAVAVSQKVLKKSNLDHGLKLKGISYLKGKQKKLKDG